MAPSDDAVEPLETGDYDCVLVTATLAARDDHAAIVELNEQFPDLPFVVRIGPGDESVAREVVTTGKTDYVRARDLEEHGDLVVQRIRTIVAANQEHSEVSDVHEQVANAAATLTAVQDATTDLDRSAEAKIGDVLEIAAERLEYPIGYVTRIDSGTQEIVAVTGDHDLLQPGATDPLGQTYCRKTIESDEPFVLEDAREEGWGDDPAFERFGLRCYVGARITVGDEVAGTICFADEQPRETLVGETQQATVNALAQLIGYELERDQYEAALERSKRRFQSLFERAPDGILIHDTDGQITDVNRAVVEALGYTEDELLSMNVSDIEVGIDRDDLLEAWGSPPGRDPLSIEGTHRRKDGSTYPTEVWVNDIELAGETRFIATARDITERKERERELERHKTFVESSDDILTLIDTDGTIEYVSPAIERILGYEPTDLVGENGFEYVHPDDRDSSIADIEWLVEASDEEMVLEFRFECAEGGYCWIESSVRDLLDDPDIGGILLSSRNITERKEHEQQLSALHDSTRQFIDADSKEEVAEIAVETASDLFGFSLPSVWYPTDDESELALVANSAEHQQLIDEAGANHPSHPRDSWIWDVFENGETVVRSPIPREDLAADVPLRSAIILPLGDHGLLGCAARGDLEFSDREVRATEILARNMQVALDQIEQQTALRRQQEFTDDLLDSIEDVVYVLDTDGDLRQWNRALGSVTGYGSETIASMNAADFFAGEDTERAAEAIEEGFETGRTRVELEFVTTDGEAIPYEFIANVFENPDGDPVMAGIGRDRTVHVEYEQELERYKELVENVPVGIYRNTPGDDGQFVEVNPAMVEMFDADSEQHLLDQPVKELYTDPDERAEFSERLENERIVSEQEMQLETLPGDPFCGSVTAIVSEADGETYFDGVVQDITDRNAYEQALAEQRDRLEILNQVVRHDVRNDMQVVKGRIGILESHIDEEGMEHLKEVQHATEDVIELTETARDLTETMLQEQEQLQPVRLDRYLESRIDTVRSTYDDAVVRTDGVLPDVSVIADDMLEAVFRNLLQNAIVHNDKEIPEVTVSTHVDEGRVRVRIADNGPGVPDHRKEAIFGKGEKGLDSPGTGLGLYLVDTLVDTYGGNVWVEDNDPEGAVFVVELPTDSDHA
ncbi:PAS domain S-box protein [Natrialba swarupiae]|uniref:PAS domain S-box protein n=1 Tax=Natrialba swarupiae TaxID=2448032 RepID=UPI00139208F4|nr:PAS domain S-box protein [Natrialba swarupiae]